MTAPTQTPFKRGKCTDKGFKIVTRWKCVDVRIKGGIDREQASRAMQAEKHFNACQFCRYFVPDVTAQTPAPATSEKTQRSPQENNVYEQSPDSGDLLDLF